MCNSSDCSHNTDKLTARPRPVDPLSLAFELEGVSPWRQQFSRVALNGMLKTIRFGGRRWLTILNSINLGLVFLAFATPLAASWGWSWLSNPVFGACHIICVQDPTHSFYIQGQQMAICQRCLAIYAVLGLVGLLFHLVRHRLRPLNFWQFGLFCLPMAVDALTQLFGWRESTAELRLLTGGLFAFGTVWYFYPYIESWMRALRSWTNRELRLARPEATA